jgi:hypothetical protein
VRGRSTGGCLAPVSVRSSAAPREVDSAPDVDESRAPGSDASGRNRTPSDVDLLSPGDELLPVVLPNNTINRK